LDIGGLEQQLRQITARIEALRPTNELEKVITSLRGDLTDIARQLTEALPRRALESLEIEVHALAQRIDHSRQSGVDSTVLAGLERGLAEVHDALRTLTPAENLVGFDDAVKTLAQKVDLIIAKEDPDTLHQLETAIDALRGIVSHVASNDTLTKVAEDVRALAAKVDGLANSTASGHAVEMLEGRLDTLTTALNASTEAGQSVPRELEKMLSGLIEKLEWVQLTHTDHAAVAHLEDRIALLIKRLDASDAKLGNLESVERGLADLLVHIDHIRGGDGAAAAATAPKPVAVDAIEREVAEIKRSERRTADSLEAVHGTVEHVVDRLAMIESGRGGDDSLRSIAIAAPAPPAAEPSPVRTAVTRPPLDPNLPPDHPLEPGSAPGTRGVPSAAERIAESEAAFDSASPPAIAPSGGQPNFIAAARRAAQAAAAAPPERSSRFAGVASGAAQPGRLRKLVVAGGAVLIAVGCLHIALRMFQDNGTAVETSSEPAQVARPSVLPETDSANAPPLAVAPLPPPFPDAEPGTPPGTIQIAPPNTAPDAPPSAKPAVAPPAIPGRQSTLRDHAAPSVASVNPPSGGARPVAGAIPPGPPTDITGSIARPAVPQYPAPGPSPGPSPASGLTAETLPATIGGPVLRAAAMAGDAAAAFEIATRYADGRGVPPSNEQAARWLERAAKRGLAPAQFRLGGLYEKGIGLKKDLAAARDLYIAAAEKGNGKAMHNLAVLYAEGINGPADYRDAAHWFREAADRGITDSQYNLAILYARGVGVEQNYAESYKWFVLAANAGDNEAAKKRDEVASHLDPQSLAAAQLAVQKWSAEPQPDDAVTVKTPPGGWDPVAQPAKTKPRSVGAKTVAPETKVN
jgi:localization factor PodJL